MKGNRKPTTHVAVAQATKDYLTPKDVAKRFAFSERHLYRLIDRGEFLEPLHFGKLLRWGMATLELWEKDGCPAPNANKNRRNKPK